MISEKSTSLSFKNNPDQILLLSDRQPHQVMVPLQQEGIPLPAEFIQFLLVDYIKKFIKFENYFV